MSSAPERFGVVGAGTMGQGIAQLACLAGLDTLLYDADRSALERAAEKIGLNLDKGAERGRWSPYEAEVGRSRLRLAASMGEMHDREVVVESVPEHIDIKGAVFTQLSETCGPETVLATNTSSIPVTRIASAAVHPDNVVGMHFFNPAPLMRLVEVIPALQTKARTIEVTRRTAEAMGRTAIEARDLPGFIVNRCCRPFYTEALRIVEEGLADPHAVDRLLRIGGGFRMGPFETMDLVGIDVGYEIARSFMELSFGEARWKPSPLQAQMVAAGRLGRKAGRGWYDYPADGSHREPDPPDAVLTADEQQLLERVQCCIVNEGAFALGHQVGTSDAIDLGARLGLNWPKGPLELGRELGLEAVLATIDELWDFYREERYRAAPMLRRQLI